MRYFIPLLALLMAPASAFANEKAEGSLNLLEKLHNLVAAFWEPIILFGHVVGFFFLVAGIALIIKEQTSPASRGGIGPLLLTVLAGVLFLNYTQFMSLAGDAIFGMSATNELAYPAFTASADNAAQPVVKFVFTVLQVFGLIGLFKALFILRTPPEQQGGFNKALKVAIGASIALNIQVFIRVVHSALEGTALADIIDKWLMV